MGSTVACTENYLRQMVKIYIEGKRDGKEKEKGKEEKKKGKREKKETYCKEIRDFSRLSDWPRGRSSRSTSSANIPPPRTGAAT